MAKPSTGDELGGQTPRTDSRTLAARLGLFVQGGRESVLFWWVNRANKLSLIVVYSVAARDSMVATVGRDLNREPEILFHISLCDGVLKGD
jgi:hypothetical protein